MRGKAIEQKWYKDDRQNGNKLYVQVQPVNLKNKQKDIDNIYNIITLSKSGFLEYIYLSYNTNFNIVAKFKYKYTSEQKARLRMALYEWNKSDTNIVKGINSLEEEVGKLSLDGNLIFIKGPAFIKELNLNVKLYKRETMKKRDGLKLDFIEFMKKYNLMILENSNIFVDSSYKQISYDDIVELLCNENFFENYKLSMIENFYKNIQQDSGIISSYYRRDFPIYRPRKRYLEFADCIYDTFELKKLSKNNELYDIDSKKVVHPCYKFNKTFIYYNQYIPQQYFVQVAKMMEPEMFEWIVNQFTNEFTPSENFTIISYPYKTDILKPLVDIYNNILYKVDETNASCFNMSNCINKEILFTQNINPLVSFNKNLLFKNKHILQSVLDGKPFETTVKYKEPQICCSKNIISIMDTDIVYIPSWLSSKILAIELAKDSVRLDPDDFTDEHIGGFIIANMMTNKDEIKRFIKEMRYENDWNKNIKVNGIPWPNISHTKEVDKPKYHRYTVKDYEKYQSLDRI